MKAGPVAESERRQKVIQSFAALVFIGVFGVPLALGSWWSLLAVPALAAVIVWRLLDEERHLVAELPGYAEYQTKVTSRLVPFLW